MRARGLGNGMHHSVQGRASASGGIIPGIESLLLCQIDRDVSAARLRMKRHRAQQPGERIADPDMPRDRAQRHRADAEHLERETDQRGRAFLGISFEHAEARGRRIGQIALAAVDQPVEIPARERQFADGRA